MVRYIFICIVGLLLATPGEVIAQQELSLEQVRERASRAGIDSELLDEAATRARTQGISSQETARLLEPAVELAEREMPARLVVQKMLEGLAKNVPPPGIRSVLQQIHGHTEQVGGFVEGWLAREEVQEMLGSRAGASENSGRSARDAIIESAVQARMQGGSESAVETFLSDLPAQTSRRPIPAQSISAVLRVLPDLPTDGASNGAPGQLLTAVLDAGYEPEEIRQFPAAIRAAVEESDRAPGVLARSAADQVARGRPAAEVLSSLFNGNVPGGPPGHVGSGPSENAPPAQGKPPGEEKGQRPPEAGGPPDDRGPQGSGPPEGRGPDGGAGGDGPGRGDGP